MGPEPKSVLAKMWGLLGDSDCLYKNMETETGLLLWVPSEKTQQGGDIVGYRCLDMGLGMCINVSKHILKIIISVYT